MTDQGVRTPVVEETIDRRGFMTRTMLGALSIFGVAFGGATIAGLWPEVPDQYFGGRFNLGRRNKLIGDLERAGKPIYNVEGRFYLVRVEDPHRFYVDAGVVAAGIMAIYQKCPHLGCRVPYCPTSGWFECPCHSGLFNGLGERQPGNPAPHGMGRFPIRIDDNDDVIVDTGGERVHPQRGFDSVREKAPLRHCI